MRLGGKVCVVTGASSGLGLALAEAMAREGAPVVAAARRYERPLAAQIDGLKAGVVLPVHLDVTQESAVEAFFAALPACDVLVNNAGQARWSDLLETSADDFRAHLEVHVVGTFLCARAALRIMAAARRGHIVNVSSISALHTFAGSASYTAAKEGQRGLTRVLVEEARRHDVRVTGLYPGAIDTPLWEGKGFDRAGMMSPARVAELVIEILVRPDLSVEELKLLPPAGIL